MSLRSDKDWGSQQQNAGVMLEFSFRLSKKTFISIYISYSHYAGQGSCPDLRL